MNYNFVVPYAPWCLALVLSATISYFIYGNYLFKFTYILARTNVVVCCLIETTVGLQNKWNCVSVFSRTQLLINGDSLLYVYVCLRGSVQEAGNFLGNLVMFVHVGKLIFWLHHCWC